jgi:hypothetical protein
MPRAAGDQSDVPVAFPEVRTLIADALTSSVDAVVSELSQFLLARVLVDYPSFFPGLLTDGFQTLPVHVECDEAAVEANQAMYRGSLPETQAQTEIPTEDVRLIKLLILTHRTFCVLHGGRLPGGPECPSAFAITHAGLPVSSSRGK